MNKRNLAREYYFVLILLSDGMMVWLAQVLGFAFRFKFGWMDAYLKTTAHDWTAYLGHFLVGTVLFFLIASWQGLYRNILLPGSRSAVQAILKSVTAWMVFYLFLTLFSRFEPDVSRFYVLFSTISMVVLLTVSRRLVQRLYRFEYLARGLRRRVALIGESGQSTDLVQVFEQDPMRLFHLVGRFSLKDEAMASDEKLPLLGSWKNLGSMDPDSKPELVILAGVEASDQQVSDIMELCAREMIQCKIVPTYFEILLSGLRLENIGGVPLLGLEQLPVLYLHNRMLKRIIDIVGAIMGLAVGGCVLFWAAWRIRFESPGPVFFPQVRTGKRGQDFRMWKLRTMREDAEVGGPGWTTPDDPRVLRSGRFMRRWNIDEIPQFWNVLKGEMSLVGPRPERPEYIERFKHHVRYYNVRHDIKPGMTGWAQIHGLRGNTSIERRVEYDLFYAENWSFWLDLHIMAVTLFRRNNAY